jgi:hypothetical protein
MEELTTSVEFYGPPGKYVELHLLAHVEGDSRKDEERRNDSSLRNFKVSAILGRSNIFPDKEFPLVAVNNGESFLVGPSDFANLELKLEGQIYVFHKNADGEYSYVELACDAIHYKQAHHLFYHGLTSYLDTLAYKGNCPIFIQAVRIEDVRNQLIVLPQVAPYRKQSVSLGDMVVYPELSPVYAMYREAKNSSSNYYKFLCFYKILEGLFGVVRPQLFKRAKVLKVQVNTDAKRIPNDPYLISEHQKYVGMSIRSFFESVLTPEFRHGVAHFMLRDGTTMNLSLPHQVEAYTHILYITELCLRVLIDDCEQILVMLSAVPSQATE